MARVYIDVEVNTDSYLEKISKIQNHISEINNLLFDLRMNNYVTAKEIAPSADGAADNTLKAEKKHR